MYRSYYEQHLYQDECHVIAHNCVRDLCYAALQRFSVRCLERYESRYCQAWSQAARCPDAKYAAELYRCLFEVTDGQCAIRSKSLYGAPGRIDIFIPSMNWVIQVLRDSTVDHISRFTPGKRHSGGVVIQDHIILDFRSTLGSQTPKGRVDIIQCANFADVKPKT